MPSISTARSMPPLSGRFIRFFSMSPSFPPDLPPGRESHRACSTEQGPPDSLRGPVPLAFQIRPDLPEAKDTGLEVLRGLPEEDGLPTGIPLLRQDYSKPEPDGGTLLHPRGRGGCRRTRRRAQAAWIRTARSRSWSADRRRGEAFGLPISPRVHAARRRMYGSASSSSPWM